MVPICPAAGTGGAKSIVVDSQIRGVRRLMFSLKTLVQIEIIECSRNADETE